MKRLAKFTLILIALCCSTSWAASNSLLDELRSMKADQFQRARILEQSLSRALPNEIESLRDQYLEARARTDLLDRYIFFTDSHFQGGDGREFLRLATLSLAEKEIKQPEYASKSLWIFLRNFAQVLEKNREAGQTPGDMLSSYLAYSPILTPKKPEGFLKQMDYTNGIQHEAISSQVTNENVAEIVESELKKSPILEPLAAPKPRPVVLIENIKTSEIPQ